MINLWQWLRFLIRKLINFNWFWFVSKIERTTRQYINNFALIHELWNRFIENCMNSYGPHTNLMIDEQLLNFQGKCPFEVYMPSQPAKYGMKIYPMNNTKTYYMISTLPYCVKVQKVKEEKSNEQNWRKETRRRRIEERWKIGHGSKVFTFKHSYY